MNEDKELQKKIDPIILDFVRKLDNLGLQTSAFIFTPKGDFVVRCGNAPHEGRDLVRLHYFLSMATQILEAEGQYERRTDFSGPTPQTPLESADKLALSVLCCPTIPEQVYELAKKYADERIPRSPEETGRA